MEGVYSAVAVKGPHALNTAQVYVYIGVAK